MKRWLQNLGEKMQIWMYGRYGYDELSKTLFIVAFVLMFLSFLFPPFSSIALVLLIWTIFRTYSRNIEKRRNERNAYLGFVGKTRQGWKRRKDMWRERKTHRYYKCPNCRVYLRVPKGRGKIEISCPKCQNKIVRTT
ncbi:MAG: hypothetical protein NC433_01650 [Clostridiales bacterium]|nr:hypothetical protein [Clostridiales bacterium]